MRTRLLCAAVGLALLAGAPVPEASARKPCDPRGSETIARSSKARVYKVVTGNEGQAVVYGCLFDVNRPRRLGLDGNYTDLYELYAVRLAGDLVGYAEACGCRIQNYMPPAVRVVNLRTRRGRFYRAYRNQPIKPRDLELKRNGSVAWTTTRWDYEDGVRFEEHAVWKNEGRRDTLLDTGRELDPLSLSRDGSVLSWRHGAETRTATLR